MNTQPGDLLDVQGVTDPETIVQANAEATARMLWRMQPTYLSNAPNNVTGPPATLARVLDETWIDKNCATYICTVAGTPGTWKQMSPAVVDANPTGIPTGYWIVRRDLNYASYYYNGSSWVAIGGGSLDEGLVAMISQVFA